MDKLILSFIKINFSDTFRKTFFICSFIFLSKMVFTQNWILTSKYYTASGFNNYTFKFAAGANILKNNYEAFQAEVKFGLNEKDGTFGSYSFLTITNPQKNLYSLDAVSIQKILLEQTLGFLEKDREEVKLIQEKVNVTNCGLLIDFFFTTEAGGKKFEENFYYLLCADKFFTVSVRHFLNKTPDELKKKVKQITIDEIINHTGIINFIPLPSLGAKLQIFPKWKYTDDGKGTVILQPVFSGMKKFETTINIKRIEHKKNPISELKAHYEQKGYSLKEEKIIDYNFLLHDKKKEIKYMFENEDSSKKIYVYYVEGKSPFNESFLVVADGLFENIKLLPLN